MRQTELAAELGLPPALLEDRVSELLAQGLLARMSEPEGIGLVKPPELISLADVLKLIYEGQGSEFGSANQSSDPIEALIRRRDAAVAETLAGVTLHSLIVAQDIAKTGIDTPTQTSS